MTKPTQNPGDVINDLAELLARRMRDVSAGLNSCLVGTITAVNSNGTVTCAVNFQKVLKGVVPLASGEIGDQVLNSGPLNSGYPVLVNVPVFTYQGGGAYIQMPIAVGDSCLLLFCDRDMDVWFETGQIAPPNSDRVHSINDAIAIVGINNLNKPLAITASPVVQLVDRTGERLCISGMMSAYGGSTAPSGWLMCDGSSYSTTTYPLLFAAIGYIYGGSGSSFNVPNTQGNILVGVGPGTTNPAYNWSLGLNYGEYTHQLSIPEMPSHGHPISFIQTGGGNPGFNSGGLYNPTANGSGTGNTGSNTPHNNVQPSLGVNWIIKI